MRPIACTKALEAFQAEILEEADIVDYREAPFVVMVVEDRARRHTPVPGDNPEEVAAAKRPRNK
jgi:hypothetical protein